MKICKNEADSLGDTSTLADPEVLQPLIEAWSKTHTHLEKKKQ